MMISVVKSWSGGIFRCTYSAQTNGIQLKLTQINANWYKIVPRPTIVSYGLMQVLKWPIVNPGFIDPKLLLFGPRLARMVLVDSKLPVFNPRLPRMGLGDPKLSIFDPWWTGVV